MEIVKKKSCHGGNVVHGNVLNSWLSRGYHNQMSYFPFDLYSSIMFENVFSFFQ